MNLVKLVAIFLIMIGVILIYDARPITKKHFGFGDRNEAVVGLKITGFVLSVIAGLMLIIL